MNDCIYLYMVLECMKPINNYIQLLDIIGSLMPQQFLSSSNYGDWIGQRVVQAPCGGAEVLPSTQHGFPIRGEKLHHNHSICGPGSSMSLIIL